MASLYLQCSGTSARSWVYRYKIHDRVRDMGLGSYPDMSLAEAREEAKKWRQVCTRGEDPIEVRRAQRQAEAGQPRQRTHRGNPRLAQVQGMRKGEISERFNWDFWRLGIAGDARLTNKLSISGKDSESRVLRPRRSDAQ